MKQIYSDKLRAGSASHLKHCLSAWRAISIGVAVLLFAAMPVVSAGEAARSETAETGGTEIMICLREQNLVGEYGAERCVTPASFAVGFGPAASWVRDNRRPARQAVAYRARTSHARPEFEALDIEQTARTHLPVAIWLLSYNVKELASRFSEPEQYWMLMRLDGHQSIGLTALDPGIGRNPTGLKAFGLRISLAY